MSGAILILGGTAESVALATILDRRGGARVISSLAGRTAAPRRPPGEVRIGGFGGAAGLAAYLRAEGIAAVVDATHPFAARMGWNAAQACAAIGLPLLRLDRPAWVPGAADHWTEAADWAEAIRHLSGRFSRAFLAVGRQELAEFAALDDLWFLLRFAETTPPDPPPMHFHLVADRGPFTVEGERALLLAHEIQVIICRNSGGTAARAKLKAAAALGLPVLMLRRPPRPDGASVASVDEAADWVGAVISG